jgi:hypothetical protein
MSLHRRWSGSLLDVEGTLHHEVRSGRALWRGGWRTKLHAMLALKKHSTSGGGHSAPAAAAAEGDDAALSPGALAALFAVVLVLGLSLNVSLELITRIDGAAGNFVSICQYSFVIGRALLFGGGGGGGGGAKEPAAGGGDSGGGGSTKGERMRAYAFITAANTGSTLLWNQSVRLGGAAFFPIFLTLCSGQIVLIMVAKLMMHGARYSLGEILGAFIMSAGMAVTVLAKLSACSGGGGGGATAAADDGGAGAAGGRLGLATAVLLVGLYVLGVQKVLQEKAFERFGKGHATVSEMVFWQHVLGLPLLLGEYKAVLAIIARWAAMPWGAWQPPAALAGALGLGVVAVPPAAWLLLAFNIVANATATSALLALVSFTNSLVASLDVTLYRFGAILVSAFVINAPPYPPPLMALGCVLVPAGSLTFIWSSHKAATAASAARGGAADAAGALMHADGKKET